MNTTPKPERATTITAFVTSDLHLNHPKIAELRGFPTPEQHDNTILRNIANTLTKHDQLWILGDISTGGTASEHNALNQLNELTPFFDMHLISGNHDTCHPMHIGSHIHLPAFNEVFLSVQSSGRRRIPSLEQKKKLWLSHFPFHGAGDRADRNPETRIHDNGRDYLIHGHIHTNHRWTGPRSLHIGLDAWHLHPVRIDTINTMILEREKDTPTP